MFEQRLSALEEDLTKASGHSRRKKTRLRPLCTRGMRELERPTKRSFSINTRTREEMEVVQQNVEQRVQEDIEDAVEKVLTAARRREAQSETRAAWRGVRRSARLSALPGRASRSSLAGSPPTYSGSRRRDLARSSPVKA